jgi:hypothetical protein
MQSLRYAMLVPIAVLPVAVVMLLGASRTLVADLTHNDRQAVA